MGGTEAAQQAADELGIPLYVAHRREAFEQQVCAYFADCYRTARTPNPCVVCNPLVKFRALTDYADEIGAPYVATGHYARTGRTRRGARLRAPRGKGSDLYDAPPAAADGRARCLFPLGKARVRTKPALRRAISACPCPKSRTVWISASFRTGMCRAGSSATARPARRAILWTRRAMFWGGTRGCTAIRSASARGWAWLRQAACSSTRCGRRTDEVVLSLEDVFEKGNQGKPSFVLQRIFSRSRAVAPLSAPKKTQ